MKKKTKTASGRSPAKNTTPALLADLKVEQKRLAAIAGKLPEPIIKEWLARKGTKWGLMMTDERRAELVRELIAAEHCYNEFCVVLDSIAEPGEETLPVELTLDRDTWIMIARAARHRKTSYGEVVSNALKGVGMDALCTMDNQARRVLS